MRRTIACRLFVYCAIVLVAHPRLAFAVRSAGIDVSNNNGFVNWTQVRSDGKDFAWAKATEGTTFTDSYFNGLNEHNMDLGTSAGLYMGAYHYAHPESNSATSEAAHFIAVAGPYLGSGYLRPMLDIESSSFTLSTSALSTWINDFCTYVTDHFPNADPLIYIGASAAASEVNSSVNIHGLDVAQWGTNPVDPVVPTGNPSTGVWSTWDFWQYGSKGRVNGIGGGTANVDVDVANGDINFVRSMLIGGTPLPTAFERFDVNGATAGSGVTSNGSYTWEAAKFSSTAAGTDAASWNEGNFLRLAAGADAAASNYSITANSNHTFAGMILQTDGGGTVTIDGAGVLSFSGDQGFFVSNSTQGLKISAVLGGTGKLVWQGSGSGTGNQSGGSLYLLGNNTYTGGTALNAGSGVNFNNDHSFGTGRITLGYTGGTATQYVLANDVATGPVTLANLVTTQAGATLIYVGPAAAPVTFTGAWTLPSGISTLQVGNASHISSKMIISGAVGGSGGAITKTGDGTLVLSGSNAYTGATLISLGTFQLGNGSTGGKLSTSSTITNNSSFVVNQTDTVTQGTDFTASAIAGTGTLTQAGTGTLVLNAANTYSGKTFVNAGMLSISSDGNLGTAPPSAVADQLTVNGGTLKSTATFSLAANRGITINNSGGTFNVSSGQFIVASKITNTTGSTVTITGGGDFSPSASNSTFTSGKWVVTGGSRWLNANNDNNSGAVPGSAVADFFTLDSGTYVNNSSHTLSTNKGITLGAGGGKIDTTNGNMTYNGVIAGGGAFTKLSANTLTLGGANSYTGTTSINGGTLQLGAGGTTGSLSTISAIIDNSNLTISRTNTVTQGTDLSASAITGTGSLIQAGAGTIVLTAANAYSGGTTVTAGGISLSGASARLGAGNVTVQGTITGTSLELQTGVADGITDAATLSLLGGGMPSIADQGYANLGSGVTEIVSSLLLGGVAQTHGLTYGSSLSAALAPSDEYFAGTGVVSVGVPGDFNADGSVDSGDYIAWRVNPAAYGGDAGYDLWRANFGTVAAPASGLSQAAVPEPTAIVLAILCGAAMNFVRTRRRKFDVSDSLV